MFFLVLFRFVGASCGGSCCTAFVTSTTYQGDFGGISGGDSICAARASAGGLSGTYFAHLSTSAVNAINRLEASACFQNRAGQQVAASRSALNSTLENAINRNEYNGVAPTPYFAWTGSYSSGTYMFNKACGDWTSGVLQPSPSPSSHGNVGMPHMLNSFWSGSSTQWSCNAYGGLYCFETPSPPVPTAYPTAHPSPYPTPFPTPPTMVPTTSPSLSPTLVSLSPSLSPTQPSHSPVTPPSPTAQTTAVPTSTSPPVDVDRDSAAPGVATSWVIGLIGVVALLLLQLAVLCLCVLRMRRKLRRVEKRDARGDVGSNLATRSASRAASTGPSRSTSTTLLRAPSRLRSAAAANAATYAPPVLPAQANHNQPLPRSRHRSSRSSKRASIAPASFPFYEQLQLNPPAQYDVLRGNTAAQPSLDGYGTPPAGAGIYARQQSGDGYGSPPGGVGVYSQPQQQSQQQQQQQTSNTGYGSPPGGVGVYQ